MAPHLRDAPLLLASASPRRRELLALLGVPFEVLPSDYEEPKPESHPDPAAFAQRLARAKALQVARQRPGRLVLGADTLVVLGRRLLGKPRDAEDADRMLRALSGRTHRVVTGVALVRVGGEPPAVERTLHADTRVTFRRLSGAEIAAYVATGEPLDKAGAYAIQGRGALLIGGIRGDYPNVVGLPLTPLALALRDLGVTVLGVP